ncbi:DUF1513 domain-containing protein [Octadecabacter ascidiaceicola]|uniref:DUF1513 domain-containing protein n=1 Tax=Octadecabacter ascidiaceicola TaxID=1655543 RepID=A0A238JLU2_9RHOB|nr:DUF1513 domain-containing protein [Octadecabacter ascidiaceicola]SMX30882.1 hypothetical protein OCA8868_00079 [Octadecabacter ascidiaceicola]
MATRRGFLAGMLASGFAPVPSWADAGSPAFLSAARKPDGDYILVGLDALGAERFRIPLPARGHAATAHPTRPEAVAFARRPGTFAMVMDCRNGDVLSRLDCPEGRHFYGHGIFDASGDLLFTTENDYDAGQGRIGLWDARNGYARIGEFASHGVGPHDVRLMPDGTLVVANGGIDTHPASGREKLNIPTMRPNLSYIDIDGQLIDHVEPDELLASIRHLTVRPDGLVGVGMQWQGELADAPSLTATHIRGQVLREIGRGAELAGYVGSIAFSGDGSQLAVTSPRAGVAQVFDSQTGSKIEQIRKEDVCGVAALNSGMLLTSGLGDVFDIGQTAQRIAAHDLSWDNHLVQVY